MIHRKALGVVAVLALAACSSDRERPAAAPSTAAGTVGTTLPASGPTLPASESTAGVTSGGGVTTGASVTTLGVATPATSTSFFAAVGTPTDLAFRPSTAALYVTSQDGLVSTMTPGSAIGTALDMRNRTAAGGERGLLGIAFHPRQPLAYLDYTDNDGDTVLDEYAIAADGTFDRGSRRQVLTIDQPYSNHNGGDIVFGPDGYLYIGMGDGGSAGDPQRRATDLSSLLGKVLRIDPLASGDQAYSVPADNPFIGVGGARPEIWSYGLRNPWRLSFDRATGDLWIADVGQGSWEEVDVARAVDGAGRGTNFGWSAFEGTHRFNEDQSPEGVTMPVFEYSHDGGGCAISGGALYRGAAIPALQGWYVYADYCTGEVHAVRPDGTSDVPLAQLAQVSAVTEGSDGELFVLSLSDGVFRLVPA